MDDSKIQSALLGWIIALAITASVFLRRDKDLRQKLFTILSGNFTLYYFFNFLYQWQSEPWFERISLVFAILLPLGAIYFFRAFSATYRPRVKLSRLAIGLGVLLIGFILHPTWLRPAIGPAVMAFVMGFMLVAILDLNVQAKTAATRVDATRIRYLFAGGLAALSLQVIERTGQIMAIEFPPLGLAMTLLYMYVISQAIVRHRILDLYEMLGRLAVMTLMGAVLAGIYTALVFWAGKGFSINAFLASLVILLLFDPLRDFVEQKIADFFFGERRVLEQRVLELRKKLAHVISIDAMVKVLFIGIEESRRFTHASLYLLDAHGRGFDCHSSFGPVPTQNRIELAAAKRFFKPFSTSGAIVTTSLEVRRERSLQAGKGEFTEIIGESLDLLKTIEADVVLLIEGEAALVGFLSVKDERIKDAFSPEEVSLLSGLAGQIAITVENSQLFQQIKERDRLAALGQMSAGLAHEIRNPLGAIKAAAQFIEEVVQEDDNDDKEFLKVIVEESDRLNRVVNDFLAYARPSSGLPSKLNANEILKRTVQIFETGRKDDVNLVIDFTPDLPAVMIDGERLHQVFFNLMLNAVQALRDKEKPQLKISTRIRRLRSFQKEKGETEFYQFVEIRFSDNGSGIPPEILQNVFIPFFTTKSSGSGLGLSICQRLIRDAGGEIELRSQVGQGTIFTVVLPVYKTGYDADGF